MFKGLFLIGSHPRHLFVLNSILKIFDEVLVIKYERENVIPDPPTNCDEKYQMLFRKHFEIRENVEKVYFGKVQKNIGSLINKIVNVRSSAELHDKKICELIKQFDAKFCLVFGTHLIKNPIIELLPEYSMNLHLGLSPWYKGDAALFWPFVMLEPQECGITFHKCYTTLLGF